MLIGNGDNTYLDNDKDSLSLSSSVNDKMKSYISVYGVDKLLDKLKISDIERYLRRKKLNKLNEI